MKGKIIGLVFLGLVVVGGVFVLNSQTPENKCIKGSTISALMYLQHNGVGEGTTYVAAEKRLVALMESECKTMPKIHLELRAQEGLYDVPIHREIELIKDCIMYGGHWDIGCRFGESLK